MGYSRANFIFTLWQHLEGSNVWTAPIACDPIWYRLFEVSTSRGREGMKNDRCVLWHALTWFPYVLCMAHMNMETSWSWKVSGGISPVLPVSTLQLSTSAKSTYVLLSITVMPLACLSAAPPLTLGTANPIGFCDFTTNLTDCFLKTKWFFICCDTTIMDV